MRKVESFEQTQLFSKQVRSLRKGCVTNFFWDPQKHPYWLAEGSLAYEEFDEGFLMFHHSGTFSNLYYIATDYDAVATMLQAVQIEDDLVVDVVLRGDEHSAIEAFEGMGFELYRSLYRMSHVGQMVQHDWVKAPCVVQGTKADAALVHHVLLTDFDPLAEQIPSLKEIEDFSERGELSVIKDGDSLCGFLIAEITGATWYLRYWYTSPDYRNNGIGAKLLRTSLINGIQSKRQIFWVLSDNENAIKRYEHFGFSRENMNDYVLIKKK